MPVDVDALHHELNAAYGFRVPRALPLAMAASDGFDISESFSLAWWDYDPGKTWHHWRHIESGYAGFVPEFFTIASPGVDGMRYGYVVHAPERDSDRLPVFEFDPVYVTLNCVAENLETALVNMAAGAAEYAAQEGRMAPFPAYTAVARALGLPPLPVSSRAEDRPLTFRPDVPAGWRYVRTEDNIGALAPADTFGGRPIDVDQFRRLYCDVPFEQTIAIRRSGKDPLAGSSELMHSLIAACRETLEAGYAGSALVGIRRTYRAMDDTGGASDGEKAAMLAAWGDVYESLGRPLLAETARHAGRVHHEIDVAQTRWVSARERYFRLPQSERQRVDQLAGPRGENLTRAYRLRYADAVDTVERELRGGQP